MRLTAPDFAVQLVNALVSWYETDESGNPLGYPARSSDTRVGLAPGCKPGSTVPHSLMPKHLARVERAMKAMPYEMQVALYYRHLSTLEQYKADTGNGKAVYYKQCNEAYWYIAGAMQG